MMRGITALKVPNYTSNMLGLDRLIEIILRTTIGEGFVKKGDPLIIIHSEDEGTKDESHSFEFLQVE